MHKYHKIVKGAVDEVLQQISGAGTVFSETGGAIGWTITFANRDRAFITLFSEGIKFVLGEREFFKVEVPKSRRNDPWIAEVFSAVRRAVRSDDEILPYADRLLLSPENVSTF